MKTKNTTPPKTVLLEAIEQTSNIHQMADRFGVSWSTIRCWLRWSGINLRPEKNQVIADCQTMTDSAMGKKYKVSSKTVEKWKKEYGLSKKIMRLESMPTCLTRVQNEIVVGKLLGDGHLAKFRSKFDNSNLAIEHSLEQKEFVEWSHKELHPFSLKIIERERPNNLKFKEHHVDTVKSCLFRTKCHPIFSALRREWYPFGAKIVPPNLDLSWRSVAVWYCDDGSTILGKRCFRRHGILCTQSFSVPDVNFLVSKLHQIGVKSQLQFDRGLPEIKLHKDTFMYFLDKIQKYVVFSCMAYKMIRNVR